MVHSQAEYIEQNSNTKRKRFRRAASLFLKSYFGINKMLFFRIVFVLYFFELSEKSGFWKTTIIHFVREGGVGSHYAGIIIGGGYLMMMVDYKGGTGVKNLRKSD